MQQGIIARTKAGLARHWPRMRLRTLIFGLLLFVAALPGFSAIFLRVYENALVRRTEAELVAQGAAIAASASLLWQGPVASAYPIPEQRLQSADRPIMNRSAYSDQPTSVDLRTSAILPPRPHGDVTTTLPDAALTVLAQRLAPAISETTAATGAAFCVLDARGVVVSGCTAGRSLASITEVQVALAGRVATTLRERDDEGRRRYPFEWLSRASYLRLHHARPIMVQGHVVGVVLVSRTPRAFFRGVYEDAGKIALGVVGIFALLLLLSGLMSRAIVRPIEALSRATRRVATGRGSIPDDPSLKVVEIETLYADFRSMAESIDHRSRYLRDFAASLSHEFKTPLAGIAGAIELLQDHGDSMTADQRQQFLANIDADAQRLSRMVRRLMDLAQADMRLPDAYSKTAVAPVLFRVADGLRADEFSVDVDVPPDLHAPIDADALSAIATTLVENARQAGARHLRVTAGRDGADFVDDGAGIPDPDRHRIFEAFFTSRRDNGGTGLGLAIARSLAEAHGGSLRLIDSQTGAHFRLEWPETFSQ